MIEQRYLSVLRRICDRLSALKHPWAITGSLGLALQSVAVEIHDVDIQSDKEGAYQIQDLLAGKVIKPVSFVESEGIRSHFSQLWLDGCKIEIMGDIEKISEQGWNGPPHLPNITRGVRLEDLSVPVLDLDYERDAYRLLNRMATVEAIEQALANVGGR